jgi:biotin carboxylase
MPLDLVQPQQVAKRILLLFPAQSYRVDSFVAAARRLGIDLLLGTDLPGSFARHGLPLIAVDFRQPKEASMAIEARFRPTRLDGIVPTNESSAVVAALAAERLGLPHVSATAVYAARNKRLMRDLFTKDGVPGPRFIVLEPNQDPKSLLPAVRFPCVVKPTMLTGSQGVIRANDPAEFLVAVRRVRIILARHGSDACSDPDFHHLLVEDYIPGREVVVEAVVSGGSFRPLAIFDKPDDLVGPCFEETLYITPSRLPSPMQSAILEVAEHAARAIGLSRGPLHVELRVDGPRVAVVEIAGRSMGGLCSRVLDRVTGPLEDIILSQAAGLELPVNKTMSADGKALKLAAGVMMMPIPRSGVLRRVTGMQAAQAVPGVEGVTVTLNPGESIRTLPEGASYLGFIFALGATPDEVEQSLRASFAELKFELSPLLELWPTET